MPARDTYHNVVRNALIKDGWTITHDPLHLTWGKRDLFVDLGAEKLFGAEKEGRRIAVEIKSFRSRSDMHDLAVAVGQYDLYAIALSQTMSARVLYLAIPSPVLSELFTEPVAQILIQRHQIRLLVFSVEEEAIEQWIP